MMPQLVLDANEGPGHLGSATDPVKFSIRACRCQLECDETLISFMISSPFIFSFQFINLLSINYC